MTKHTRYAIGTLCTFFLGVGTSHATLIDRGGGLIYDDVLNVTWMQDAGYARTIGLGDKMNWTTAMAYADSAQYFDTARGVTWDDWRLPSTVNGPGSVGYETTAYTSELAYMYYVNLGYAANTTYDVTSPVPTSSNYNPFVNLAYRGYWSGTLSDNPTRAWEVHFHFGLQDVDGISDTMYAWLVRDGDVGNRSVPEPGSLALFGIALGGFGLARRRKARRS